MDRRRYLASCVLGTAVLAGCSGSGGTGDAETTDTDTPTPTPNRTEVEPAISLVDASPAQSEFYPWEDVLLNVEFENGGSLGSIEYEVQVDGDQVLEETVRVPADGSETKAVVLTNLEPGSHEYRVAAGEDTIDGVLTVLPVPVERPARLPDYLVLEKTDFSTSQADRLRVDVQIGGDADAGIRPPGREALLNVCREIVHQELAAEGWDAIEIDFWRTAQEVGGGAAHAAVTWGPEGNWSGAGAGEGADYSSHEFSVEGVEYLVTEGVEDIETDKWDFRVEFDVVNYGVVPVDVSGSVSTPGSDPKEFEADLGPGERFTVLYEAEYDGARETTTYEIDTFGRSVLYGPTSGTINFY
jgi:hypothetical protein